MTRIIDRRKNTKHKSSDNRRKFMERYKDSIKEAVDKAAGSKTIKDFATKQNIKIPKKDINEPTFRHHPQSGDKTHVAPGNDRFNKGDKIWKPDQEASSGTGAGSGFDDFHFTLSKEEFLDVYFSNLALPNFIKESLGFLLKYKYVKKGYSTEGIPARLNVKKTLESAIARRIATKRKKGKIPFLDDVDARYDLYAKESQPIRHAVMICLMDVSGSMDSWQKELAKKFYILLYLFLHQDYKSVDIIFIRYHSEPSEVTEEEFFYGQETGGTLVSPAFELALEIMKERYQENNTNFYIAHVSDGDNPERDHDETKRLLTEGLLPRTQYVAYLQVETERRARRKEAHLEEDLLKMYREVQTDHRNVGAVVIYDPDLLMNAFHELFKTDGSKT